MARRPTTADPDPGVLGTSPVEPAATSPASAPASQAPDIEGLLAKHLQPFNDRFAKFETSIEELRAARSTPVAQAPVARSVDPATQMFVDPASWQSDFRAQVVDTIRKELVDPIRQEQKDYQQQQALDRFWRDFKTNHADLADDMDVVQALASQHVGELTKMDTVGASTKLAEISRAKIIDIAKRHTKRETTSSRSTVEAPSVPGLTASRQEAGVSEDENRGGISEIIRRRRQARRDAGKPTGAGVH